MIQLIILVDLILRTTTFKTIPSSAARDPFKESRSFEPSDASLGIPAGTRSSGHRQCSSFGAELSTVGLHRCSNLPPFQIPYLG